MEKKSFKVGDVVRYADGWCNKGEESAKLVVVEAFGDVQKARIVNPAVTYAFGAHRNEWVTYDMIESADRRRDQPEVFYTGGGIWLSAMYVAPHIYCVVDNDVPADADDVEDQDCLSWYDDREDDSGEWFACQGFIRSENVKDLSAEEHEIWARLREALLREMW